MIYLNVVVEIIVMQVKLKVELHPHSYNVAWVKDIYLCDSHMSCTDPPQNYEKSVWCDVILKNVAHVLLMRP